MVAEYQVVPRAAQVMPRGVTAVPGTHGQWLVLQRQARGWSVAQMARKLREAATAAGDRLPGRDSLIVMIHRWENNRSGISERYRLHYCRAFQIPAGWFGNPAALDVPPGGGTSQPGPGHIPGQHPGTGVTRPARLFPGSDAAGSAGQLPSLRDRMHATVDQLGNQEDRDQFCFLLGYLSALVTTLPRAPSEVSRPMPAEPCKADSRDG